MTRPPGPIRRRLAVWHALANRGLGARNLRASFERLQPLLEDSFLFLGLQHGADLIADLVESRRLGRAALEELDDVVPELGVDDLRDLLGWERKGGLRKLRNHLVARDEVQITALPGAARILRVLLGQRLKRVGSPLQPRQNQTRLAFRAQENVDRKSVV